jgi:hypothetical protein
MGKANLRDHIAQPSAPEILQVAAEIDPGPNWKLPLHVEQNFSLHVTAGRGIKSQCFQPHLVMAGANRE